MISFPRILLGPFVSEPLVRDVRKLGGRPRRPVGALASQANAFPSDAEIRLQRTGCREVDDLGVLVNQDVVWLFVLESSGIDEELADSVHAAPSLQRRCL